MEKYGWQYNISGDKSNLKMEVIPHKDKMKQLPETLFKIYSLNSNSIDALLNSYIYGSHPSEFNDLFDCHKDLIEWDANFVYDLILIYYNNDKCLFKFSDFSQDFHLNKIKYVNVAYQILYRTFGIYCMSENIKNATIWANYCKNNGFALEFDIEHLKSDLERNNYKPFGPFQINYQESIEKIQLNKGKFEAILYQTNIKDINWKYEHEWRLLIESKPDTPLEIPLVEFEKMGVSEKECMKFKAEKRKFNITNDSIRSIRLSLDFFKNEELRIVIANDTEFIINLKDGNKICVLNFIYEHSIDLYLSVPDNQRFQINFKKYMIEKIKINEFKLIKIK